MTKDTKLVLLQMILEELDFIEKMPNITESSIEDCNTRRSKLLKAREEILNSKS